jgi:hypothetical protein
MAPQTPRGAKRQKTVTPRNAEDTEIRRKGFCSATLGGFGEVRRMSFYLWLKPKFWFSFQLAALGEKK